jgi:uncharacterized membrane-anchored protein
MKLDLCTSALLSAALFAAPALPSATALQETEPSEEREGQDEEGAEELDPELLKEIEAFNSLPWVDGPTTGDLGRWAHVEVPEGMRFLGAEGTRKYLELCGNTTDGDEFGLVCPPDAEWFAVYEFDESGYVEDEDKADLDAEALLESLKEGQEQDNEERRKLGFPTLEILGWMTPPHYDEQTHNLEWATSARSGDGETSANHNTRLLGRRGVMSVTLVASPEELENVLPAYRQQLSRFSFKSGERYSEYVKGDRVAEYGLTALIAGGAGVAALKSGLLAKLWKFIVGGLAALFVGLKKFLAGKKRASTTRVRTAPATTNAPPAGDVPTDADSERG